MCDDFDGEFNDYGDDGFDNNETDDYTDSETNDSSWGGPGWEWIIIGPLSEEIAEEEKEKEKIRRDMFGDDYMGSGTGW
jgi:hypothetical protein